MSIFQSFMHFQLFLLTWGIFHFSHYSALFHQSMHYFSLFDHFQPSPLNEGISANCTIFINAWNGTISVIYSLPHNPMILSKSTLFGLSTTPTFLPPFISHVRLFSWMCALFDSLGEYRINSSPHTFGCLSSPFLPFFAPNVFTNSLNPLTISHPIVSPICPLPLPLSLPILSLIWQPMLCFQSSPNWRFRWFSAVPV